MERVDGSTFYERAKNNTGAVDLIKYISIEIWNRIGFVYSYKKTKSFMRIYETTLTQNLMYEIVKFAEDNKKAPIYLQESKNESANGSDLLLCLKFNQEYLQFPIQSKLLSPDEDCEGGEYRSFKHWNKRGFQLNLIEKYAEKLGGHLAFYFLYNYVVKNPDSQKKEDVAFYGCSYFATKQLRRELRRKKTVTFKDIHPSIAKPLYHLFADITGGGNNSSQDPKSPSGSGKFDDVIDFFGKFGISIDESYVTQKLKFLTKDEIANPKAWRNLIVTDKETSYKEVEGIEESKRKNSKFNPRYRIILDDAFLDNEGPKGQPVTARKTVEKEEEVGAVV